MADTRSVEVSPATKKLFEAFTEVLVGEKHYDDTTHFKVWQLEEELMEIIARHEGLEWDPETEFIMTYGNGHIFVGKYMKEQSKQRKDQVQ
jgi:hypothetical protein